MRTIACYNPEKNWIRDCIREQKIIKTANRVTPGYSTVIDSCLDTWTTNTIHNDSVWVDSGSISTNSTSHLTVNQVAALKYAKAIIVDAIEEAPEIDVDVLAANNLVEDFARFCAEKAQVDEEEFLNLPLKSLIAYLIVKAAKKDDLPDEAVQIESTVLEDAFKKERPRCLQTGKFLSQAAWDAGIRFSSPEAMQDYMERLPA